LIFGSLDNYFPPSQAKKDRINLDDIDDCLSIFQYQIQSVLAGSIQDLKSQYNLSTLLETLVKIKTRETVIVTKVFAEEAISLQSILKIDGENCDELILDEILRLNHFFHNYYGERFKGVGLNMIKCRDRGNTFNIVDQFLDSLTGYFSNCEIASNKKLNRQDVSFLIDSEETAEADYNTLISKLRVEDEAFEVSVPDLDTSWWDMFWGLFWEYGHPSKNQKYRTALDEIARAYGEDQLKEDLQKLEEEEDWRPLYHALLCLVNPVDENYETPRGQYDAFIKALKGAVELERYSAVIEGEPNNNNNNNAPFSQIDSDCAEILNRLIDIRWTQVEMFKHGKDVVDLFIQEYQRAAQIEDGLEPITKDNFREMAILMNEMIEKAPAHVKKSFFALNKQKLEGHFNLEQISEGKNIPCKRKTMVFVKDEEEREVHNLRHGRVADLNCVAPLYQAFVRNCGARDEGVINFDFQKRVVGNDGDGESKAVQHEEEMQSECKNFFHMVQTHDGKIFKKQSAYPTFGELFDCLWKEFGFEQALYTDLEAAKEGESLKVRHCALPYIFYLEENQAAIEEYKTAFREMFEGVYAHYFKGNGSPEDMTHAGIKDDLELQTFLLIFYAVQRDDMLFRIEEITNVQIKYTGAHCKDAQDRAGANDIVGSLLRERAINGMSDSETLSDILKVDLSYCILNKKQGMIFKGRLEPALAAAQLIAEKEPFGWYRFGFHPKAQIFTKHEEQLAVPTFKSALTPIEVYTELLKHQLKQGNEPEIDVAEWNGDEPPSYDIDLTIEGIGVNLSTLYQRLDHCTEIKNNDAMNDEFEAIWKEMRKIVPKSLIQSLRPVRNEVSRKHAEFTVHQATKEEWIEAIEVFKEACPSVREVVSRRINNEPLVNGLFGTVLTNAHAQLSEMMDNDHGFQVVSAQELPKVDILNGTITVTAKYEYQFKEEVLAEICVVATITEDSTEVEWTIPTLPKWPTTYESSANALAAVGQSALQTVKYIGSFIYNA